MSVDDEFDIPTKLSVPPPCYVRKVDRATHCGTREDSPEKRADLISINVLSEDDGIMSVFYVASACDVTRAALALNWSRAGTERVEELCLIAFTAEELRPYRRKQTENRFACLWARENHYNVRLRPSDQIELARVLAERQRFPHKFTRSKMIQARDARRLDGCHSTTANSSGCVCRKEHRVRRLWRCLLKLLRSLL